jgi:hypothetical protein
MTQLRIVQTDLFAKSFGFAGDDNSLGFGSSNARQSQNAGILLKLVYTTDSAVHG